MAPLPGGKMTRTNVIKTTFKIMRTVSEISSWYNNAIDDGKIKQEEVILLAKILLNIWESPIYFEKPLNQKSLSLEN